MLTHRYYDPVTGRFVTRDPIGYDGGLNLYAYTLDNPIMGIDPSGYMDVDPNTGERILPYDVRVKANNLEAQVKKAYIFVGNTHSSPILQPFVDLGDFRDVENLTYFFELRGYDVSVAYHATQKILLKDIPKADAVAFIGHNGNPGGDMVFQTSDNCDFAVDDINKALNGRILPQTIAASRGRHFDYAIFHVCASNTLMLRDITIGNSGGYFYAPKHFWSPVYNMETKIDRKFR